VTRLLLLIIGFSAALAPTIVHAQQTNLDQGKSASQLFAGSCAECHKAAHGLAKGKNADTVAAFLREHYTTGRDQAAALAAYIVGGRDTVANPAPGKKQPEHASASTEEAKPDTKPEKRREQKPKPEENATANAKPRQPAENEKPREEANHGILPGFLSPAPKPEKPATASRNRRKEPATPEAPQEPAAIAHAPAVPAVTEPAAHAETLKPEEAPAAAAKAPAETAPTESGEPVPRDNVPD